MVKRTLVVEDGCVRLMVVGRNIENVERR